MASNIRQQMTQPYVGELVELFHIDLRPIGVPMQYYFTPSSEFAIKFNGQTYTPMPIAVTGLSEDNNTAPGRVNLSVSNLTYMLTAMVLQHGDMVGAVCNYTRTFKNFLDGEEDGGTQQALTWLKFIFFQKKSHNTEMIQWVMTTQLDRPDVKLPLRQCLKSDIAGHSLYAPGMARSKL